MEQPVWQPGKSVPAEPLGTGVAIETRPPAPTPAPAPVRTPTPVPPSRRPSVPRPPSRGGGGLPERPPWLVPAAVAIVIVLLLGIVGFVVLSHRGGGGPGPVAKTSPSPHASTSPHASPSSSPTGHNPQAVPAYAPASADPVSKVQICTTDSPCAIPGSSPETASNCSLSSCKVEVAIYFTSVQKSASYSYILKFFDRCTGQTTDLPGPNPATTPPTGYIVAIPSDHWSVTIPGGVKSGALVAVSQAPAIAASPPLLLGADTC
jgi:hypothetical protein